MEEQTFNVAEAIIYFLQGLGYSKFHDAVTFNFDITITLYVSCLKKFLDFPIYCLVPSVIMSRLARHRTLSASSSGSQDNETKKRQRTLSGGSTGAGNNLST